MYEDLIVPFIVAPAVIILIYLKHRYSRSGLGAPVEAVEASGKLAEAAPIIVHVYDSESGTVESFVPLENAEEFIDAEHLSSDELTGKLARKCFDSDAESSESEPDFSGDEAEDENDEPAEE
uniref:Preprotein translocase subunit YajC n=1 Tax=Panagrellus redivivus TaxID=6233 RepID=A0A7E4ZR80_PANRE